jgi:hypothetical protein
MAKKRDGWLRDGRVAQKKIGVAKKMDDKLKR